MKLPLMFSPSKKKKQQQQQAAAAAADSESSGAMDRKHPTQQHKRTPRLERRNAVKNIDYEAGHGSEDYYSPTSGDALRTWSLDLPLPPSLITETSFRIDGEYEGEVDIICRNLGLSGPDDFAIPAAAWEAQAVKRRSSSDLLPRSRLLHLDGEPPDEAPISTREDSGDDGGATSPSPSPSPSHVVADGVAFHKLRSKGEEDHHSTMAKRFSSIVTVRDVEPPPQKSYQFDARGGADGAGVGGGIRGPRPPILAPPPSMSLPVLDTVSTTWDLLKDFAPEVYDDTDGGSDIGKAKRSAYDSEDDEKTREVDDEDSELRLGVSTGEELTGSSSFTTSNDDDSPSTAMVGTYVISPNRKRFKREILGWIQGKELGRGSFGTVYEAINDDGFFFAIKEVSLLDQGSNAQQCIQQLEQEIALLSNFEHENIVLYLGTKKEEAKLYIFLELVTQGSLASLYQKYHLRDSQVSAYTRQILNGLKYLHDRNVVHRDIKCANILVAASGSVKLADFGLAKETSKLNALKSCKGSVYWMAPEVVKPRQSYGPAADIWSLGCTVLEMLTQKLPYPNLEWTQALFKIGRGEKPDIPDSLSKDARDFINQCVQVDPDDRPTASKLLDHPFVKRQLSTSSGSSSSDFSAHGRRT